MIFRLSLILFSTFFNYCYADLSQATIGDNSPNVNGVSGDVNITYGMNKEKEDTSLKKIDIEIYMQKYLTNGVFNIIKLRMDNMPSKNKFDKLFNNNYSAIYYEKYLKVQSDISKNNKTKMYDFVDTSKVHRISVSDEIEKQENKLEKLKSENKIEILRTGSDKVTHLKNIIAFMYTFKNPEKTYIFKVIVSSSKSFVEVDGGIAVRLPVVFFFISYEKDISLIKPKHLFHCCFEKVYKNFDHKKD